MNTIFPMLAGVVSSSLITGVAIYSRDIFYKNWSGWSPLYKVWWIPLFFLAGIVVASFANIIVYLIGYGRIRRLLYQYVIGYISGFVGIGTFLSYWLNNIEVVSFLFVVAIAIGVTIYFGKSELRIVPKVNDLVKR